MERPVPEDVSSCLEVLHFRGSIQHSSSAYLYILAFLLLPIFCCSTTSNKKPFSAVHQGTPCRQIRLSSYFSRYDSESFVPRVIRRDRFQVHCQCLMSVAFVVTTTRSCVDRRSALAPPPGASLTKTLFLAIFLRSPVVLAKKLSSPNHRLLRLHPAVESDQVTRYLHDRAAAVAIGSDGNPKSTKSSVALFRLGAGRYSRGLSPSSKRPLSTLFVEFMIQSSLQLVLTALHNTPRMQTCAQYEITPLHPAAASTSNTPVQNPRHGRIDQLFKGTKPFHHNSASTKYSHPYKISTGDVANRLQPPFHFLPQTSLPTRTLMDDW
jgi:hypothetical protein